MTDPMEPTESVSEKQPEILISASGLQKRYGRSHVLKNINLNVPKGSIYAFIGPNGAGKTTTLRILLGVIRARSGEARAFGMDCWRKSYRIRKRLAYVPCERGLYERMSGGQFLRFAKKFYPDFRKDIQTELLDRFRLPLKKRVQAYSTGMKRQLFLAHALSTGVELLILDEPTHGLDPLVTECVLAEIVLAKQRGVTILLSSHILGQIERVCDHVGVVNAGETIFEGTLEQLKRYSGFQLRIKLNRAIEPGDFNLPGVSDVEQFSPTEAAMTIHSELSQLLPRLANLPIGEISYGASDLRTELLRLYGYKPPKHDDNPQDN
ncbi:MAG TPA: ABC transporter ATP-binding protein [Candidatus Brocadiia bacterium]|nr:ABC transporter ATP-binding protein [Candidatus Brocadiia bacterium]